VEVTDSGKHSSLLANLYGTKVKTDGAGYAKGKQIMA